MKVDLGLVDKTSADQCEHVLKSAFAPFLQKLGREQAADAYSQLPGAIAEQRVYGAFDRGRLVGAAIVATRDQGRTIEQIGVDPSHQGCGIGSRLLGLIEADARGQEQSALFLDPAEMMTDLLRLYGRQGFRELRKGLPIHGKDKHQRVFMKKDL